MLFLRAVLFLCVIISGVGAHKGGSEDERPIRITAKPQWVETVEGFIDQVEAASDTETKKRFVRLAVICFVGYSDDFHHRIEALSWLPRQDKFRIKTLVGWFNSDSVSNHYEVYALSLLPRKHPLRVARLDALLEGFSPRSRDIDQMVTAALLLPRQHMRRIEVLSAVAGDNNQEEESRLDAAMGLPVNSGVRAAALKDLFVNHPKIRPPLVSRLTTGEGWTDFMVSIACDGTLDFETREYAADMLMPGTDEHKKCYESLVEENDIDDNTRADIQGILRCYP